MGCILGGRVGIITPKFMSLLPYGLLTNFVSNQVILSQFTVYISVFQML